VATFIYVELRNKCFVFEEFQSPIEDLTIEKIFVLGYA